MIWFTSDHHFGHENIIKYDGRPFANVEEMNEEMIRRWNSVVSSEDEVFYLGDFSLSRIPLTTILPRLNGNIHLIAGNHDRPHPAWAKKGSRAIRFTAEYLAAGFASVALEDEILIGLERVKMTHMPYRGDHTEAGLRYPEWRPKDEGQWLLHGHVHTAWKIRDKMINVGAPAWDYYPVSIELIKEIMNEVQRG